VLTLLALFLFIVVVFDLTLRVLFFEQLSEERGLVRWGSGLLAAFFGLLDFKVALPRETELEG
jgi:hypothetical protein